MTEARIDGDETPTPFALAIIGRILLTIAGLALGGLLGLIAGLMLGLIQISC